MTGCNSIHKPLLLAVHITVLFFSFFGVLKAQNLKDYLEIEPKAVLEGKPCENVDILITTGTTVVTQARLNEGQKTLIKLALGKEYLVDFSKDGYLSKKVSIVTNVPVEEKSIFYFMFKVNLQKPFQGVEGLDEFLKKPSGKIAFDPALADFNYDKAYSKAMKEEYEALKNAALAKAKADAEAKAKLDAEAKAKLAEEARFKEEAEKQKLLELKMKQEAEAKEKSELEAKRLNELKAIQEEREKQKALATQLKNDKDAKIKSEDAARYAADLKAKQEADEREKAAIALKLKEEDEARIQAEAAVKVQLEKANAAKKQKELKEQEEADVLKAKLLAEIQEKTAKELAAKEKALNDAKAIAKSNQNTLTMGKGSSDQNPVEVTEMPPEKDVKKTVSRTIVKQGGVTDVYRVVAFSWGGMFYFKNDVSVTQTTFDQELKAARAKIIK